MADAKFTYSTIGMAQYWLEEGWYTVEQLEQLLEHKKRMDVHLRKSIEQTNETIRKHNAP